MFVLCDGVGGSDDGSFASKYICETIILSYEKRKIKTSDDLKEIVVKASKELTLVTDKYVATTLSLIYFGSDLVYLMHLGDTRVYYFNSKLLELKRTKDHSLVRDLFEAGILKSEAEMRTHPLKNRITRSINSKDVLDKKDIEHRIIKNTSPGDIFLLCTDGVVEVFNDTALKNMFIKEKCFTTLANRIESETNMLSHDNNSAILLELEY